MTLYAAARSFHALLALFPFLIFLLALLSVLQIPDFFDWVIEQAKMASPSDAAGVVNDVVISIEEQSLRGLLSFVYAVGLAVLLIVAGGVMIVGT